MSKQAVHNRIRTFSEGITTGSRNKTTAVFIEAGKLSQKGFTQTRPRDVENAIEYFRRNITGKLSREQRRPGRLEKTIRTLKTWQNKVNSKEYLKTVLKGKIISQQRELKYLSRILGTEFLTAKVATQTATKVGKAVKEVIPKTDKAEKILRVVAGESRTLRKALARTVIRRIIPKLLPLLGIGLTALDLANRVRRMLGKNVPDEFGEINPRDGRLGENYHCSVGWY